MAPSANPISAALAAGPEAGEDRSRRWVASVTAGVVLIWLGIASSAFGTLVTLAPEGVFAAVAGEEQSLLGSGHWAKAAAEKKLGVAGMLNNDIVGNSRAEDGKGGDRSDDVEQADDANRPGTDLGRQPAVEQVRRQVDGHESQLEAAGEEAEHEKNVAAMPERLGEGLLQRLRGSAWRASARTSLTESAAAAR